MGERTIDFSRRGWGHNYNVLSATDGGKRLRLATWSTPTPNEGDFLILCNTNDETTRYRAEEVTSCSGVDDMSIVEASFAPRGANTRSPVSDGGGK